MAHHITKAVIPAAGLGTRFLPATKAMPKEMLPVVDKPAIQYVVEEAVAAGLHDVLMVTGRNKYALENHFDRVYELEATLERKGDHAKLKQVNESTNIADIHYFRQGDPMGLGHAVLQARMHVGHEPFAVLLGDDLIDRRESLLSRMIAEQANRRRRRTWSGSPDSSRSPPRRRPPRTSPSSAGTCCGPRCSPCCSTPTPARVARSS
jgi:UTP--glucose-1-phosphate uridylyltransferase